MTVSKLMGKKFSSRVGVNGKLVKPVRKTNS